MYDVYVSCMTRVDGEYLSLDESMFLSTHTYRYVPTLYTERFAWSMIKDMASYINEITVKYEKQHWTWNYFSAVNSNQSVPQYGIKTLSV